jgi:hypothetical protein
MNDKVHYYEITGEARQAVLDLFTLAAAQGKKSRALAKEFGADGVVYSGSFGQQDIGGFTFKNPPDDKLWKRFRNGSFWMPRLSTKEGKAIRARMREIKIPGGADFAAAINMDVFCVKDNRWHTPGVHVAHERVFVVVPDGVTPKDGRRISDIEFEQLTAEKSKGG